MQQKRSKNKNPLNQQSDTFAAATHLYWLVSLPCTFVPVHLPLRQFVTVPSPLLSCLCETSSCLCLVSSSVCLSCVLPSLFLRSIDDFLCAAGWQQSLETERLILPVICASDCVCVLVCVEAWADGHIVKGWRGPGGQQWQWPASGLELNWHRMAFPAWITLREPDSLQEMIFEFSICFVVCKRMIRFILLM